MLTVVFPAAADNPTPQPSPPAVSTFGVAPADSVKVDGRSALFYSASPGAALTDHVAIVNSGTTPIDLEVYPSGAIPSASGEFSLATVADRGLDVGSWLALNQQPQTLTVAPRSSAGPGVAILGVSLKVPADATPGDHAGAVVASLTSSAISKSGQHFQLLQRVAVRVYVRVSGALHPGLAVEHLKATYQRGGNPTAAGQTTLTFTVRNSGNVKLGGLVTADISDLFGSKEHASLPNLPLLLPGAVVPQTVTLPGVYPAGRLGAAVTVLPVAVPGDVDPGIGPSTAHVSFWALPFSALVLAVIAVVAAVAAASASLGGLSLANRFRTPRPRRAKGKSLRSGSSKHSASPQRTRVSRRSAS